MCNDDEGAVINNYEEKLEITLPTSIKSSPIIMPQGPNSG